MGLLSKIAAYIYGEDPYERYLEQQQTFEKDLSLIDDNALAAHIGKLATTLRGTPPNYTDPEGQKSHNTRNQEFYTALNIMKDRVTADGIAAHAGLQKIMIAASAVDPNDQYAPQCMARAILSATTPNTWAQALKP